MVLDPADKGLIRRQTLKWFGLGVSGVALMCLLYSNVIVSYIHLGTFLHLSNIDNPRDNTRRVTGTGDQYCSPQPNWSSSLPTSKTLTDLSNWDFYHHVGCPRIDVDHLSKNRTKVLLDCSIPSRLILSATNDSSDVFQVNFGDKCLQRVIDACCSDNKPVPNVVHYIWFNKIEFSFVHLLSFLSALRYMRPCLFLIHGDVLPYGKFWDFFIKLSPNVIHVKRPLLTHIYGHKLAFKEHSSDVMRIEALREYGGVYLDWDQLILRSVEPLRKFEFTEAMEESFSLGNQMIISKRNATFLRLWHEGYKNYVPGWIENSMRYPLRLSRKFPQLIHIEGYNFTRPNYTNLHLFYKDNYDWSTNYAMHLYFRHYKVKVDLEIIRKMNATLGSVSRHVLFGNKELCV